MTAGAIPAHEYRARADRYDFIHLGCFESRVYIYVKRTSSVFYCFFRAASARAASGAVLVLLLLLRPLPLCANWAHAGSAVFKIIATCFRYGE